MQAAAGRRIRADHRDAADEPHIHDDTSRPRLTRRSWHSTLTAQAWLPARPAGRSLSGPGKRAGGALPRLFGHDGGCFIGAADGHVLEVLSLAIQDERIDHHELAKHLEIQPLPLA